MRRAIVTAGLCLLWAGQAGAGPIEQACLKSGRSGAGGAVCGCIQQVADMTLTSADQRRAAKFFRNPEAAEKTRASDSAANEAFWARYLNFGSAAEAFCAG